MEPNWIPDRNPYSLSEPPQWWLTQLRAFDPLLVVVPSRTEAKYLLTRRLQYTFGLSELAIAARETDTEMLVTLKLVPVMQFTHEGVAWVQAGLTALLDELRRRDTWQFKDGDAAVDAVEAFERQEAQRQRAKMREDFGYRARDAWRSLQARTGQRSKRASDYHGVAPTTVQKPTAEVAST